MSRPATVASKDVIPDVPVAVSIDPAAGALDALTAAISEAIEALKVCNFPAFESAVERQRTLCDHLVRHAEWRQTPNAAAAARQVRELNRVYDRLLRHSIQWTRTLQSIFEAAGNPPPARASVHFRG